MSLAKRQKINGDSRNSLSLSQNNVSSLLHETVLLEGHEGSVLASRFSPDGRIIASGGADKKLWLWNTPLKDIITDPEEIPANFAVLTGHRSAITSIRWTRDGESLATASADRTVGLWDLNSGRRVRKFTGHNLVVNEVDTLTDSVSRDELVASVSDDQRLLLWDTRQKSHVAEAKTAYPLLTVAASKGATSHESTGNAVYVSGLDPTVYAYDVRNFGTPLFDFETLHSDAVSSIALSDDNSTLVSNSMDGTIRFYDITRTADQFIKPILFDEAPAGNEKLLIRTQIVDTAHDTGRGIKYNSLVFAGSADTSVTVWSTKPEKLLGKLYGHQGTVVDVDIHPMGNIILSGSVDSTLVVREV